MRELIEDTQEALIPFKKGVRFFISKLKKLLKFIIIIFIIIGIFIGISLISDKKRINNMSQHIVNDIYSLMHYNELKKLETGEFLKVTDFDLYEDTLPFSNFSSLKSYYGNCEGYSTFEYLNFHKDIKEYLNIELLYDGIGNLGDIDISKEDLDILNNSPTDSAFIEDYKYTASDLDYLIKDKSNVSILKNTINYYFSEPTENIYSIEAANLKFKNNDYEKIIKDITYLQNNIYINNIVEPGYYKNDFTRVDENYSGYVLEILLNNIYNNKLSVIAFNNYGGHALLVYAYEILDDNNIKVYVKDSNLTISTSENLTEEQMKINKEIEENCYILFTFDFTGSYWNYIYNPNILGTSLYGEYNSFVPGINLIYYDFENIY